MGSERDSRSGGAANGEDAGRGSKWWLLLLLLPYLGLLYPPIYARLEPALFGIPFFIWYQFLWVFITVAITAVVYRTRG